MIKSELRDRRRLAHCFGISLDMLRNGALALNDNDYSEMRRLGTMLTSNLRGAQKVRVTTHTGRDILFSVEDRFFFIDLMLDWQLLKWLNLLLGEVISAPVECSANGVLVCDLTVGSIGNIDGNIKLTVDKGKVINIEGECESSILEKMKKALNIDNWSSIIGVFAFGINHKARVSEKYIETEKILGSCDIAFGYNLNYPGGQNCANNHIDFLFSRPTVEVFTKTKPEGFVILKEGIFQI